MIRRQDKLTVINSRAMSAPHEVTQLPVEWVKGNCWEQVKPIRDRRRPIQSECFPWAISR